LVGWTLTHKDFHLIRSTKFLGAPNGLRMSRLADLAGYLPQNIILGFNAVENTNEDTKPKAKSAPCAGWAVFSTYYLFQLAFHILQQIA
jgi:hypothetical protein